MSLAAGPMPMTANGLALTSAADNRLVFNGLRKMPSDWTTCEPRLNGFWMSGPDCSTRPARRTSDLSRRSSPGLA